MDYFPRFPSFRGFYDPPTLWEILSTIMPIVAPIIWAKRQRIMSFLGKNLNALIEMSKYQIATVCLHFAEYCLGKVVEYQKKRERKTIDALNELIRNNPPPGWAY